MSFLNNGGIIGYNNIPKVAGASGVWGIQTVYTSIVNKEWPVKLTQGLKYFWYDTSTTALTHPLSESAFDAFFDLNTANLSFGGSGIHTANLNWSDNGATGAGGLTETKPGYLPAEGYSWKVEGYLYAPESGEYRFGVDGDDAIDLFIDGVKVAFWYSGHGFSQNWSNGALNVGGQVSMPISLKSGNYYTFVARMEEISGGDGVQVGWKPPSNGSISIIPYTYFYY